LITLDYEGRDRRMMAVFNCADRERSVSLPDGDWQLVLSTADEKYAGRVRAGVHASAGIDANARAPGSRLSGDEWKSGDLGPRTLELGPWTAAALSSEAP
jgi:hypothetical protein